MRINILLSIGVLGFFAIMGTISIMEKNEINKKEHDQVTQHCLSRGYLTYSITTHRNGTHRFCLSSDGVLHLPNLVDDSQLE